jgi:hypothetical protein
MYSKRSSVFLLPNTELPGNNKAKSRKSEDIKRCEIYRDKGIGEEEHV